MFTHVHACMQSLRAWTLGAPTRSRCNRSGYCHGSESKGWRPGGIQVSPCRRKHPVLCSIRTHNSRWLPMPAQRPQISAADTAWDAQGTWQSIAGQQWCWKSSEPLDSPNWLLDSVSELAVMVRAQCLVPTQSRATTTYMFGVVIDASHQRVLESDAPAGHFEVCGTILHAGPDRS